MSDILCRWLNEELRLSQAVEPKTLDKDFSSGYLIGEILHKYQLQTDFSMFTKKNTSISKLNNFTRLEPTLHLLGISFNINTAQALMQEKQSVARHLLHQLYISLENKKKAQISGTVMEIMQPAANAGLHQKEHEIYSDRLHQMAKRDAELKLQKISQHYGGKFQQWNNRSVMIPPIVIPPQQKRQLKVKDVQKMKNIDKATIVQFPKPPPYTSKLNLKRSQRQQKQRAQQAQMVQTEIAQFETNRKKLVSYGHASSISDHSFHGDISHYGSSQDCDMQGSGAKLVLRSNSKYVQDIRRRLGENAAACEQRQKRLDRFLMEQLKSHEAEEEARQEEQLVKHLTRQTQQEQRLTAQLLQIRRQKEVIRENRLFREQQYQQRRDKDFKEALEREAILAQQAKLERAEEIRKDLEFSHKMVAERAQTRHKKHFAICKDILEQIVDLALKVGEYRLLTGNLILEKQMREWKELLLSGLPLYESIKSQRPEFDFSTPLDPVELKKQEILNNQDYDEYIKMVGEWEWPEDAGETKLPLTNNNILGHVVARLDSIVQQHLVESTSPSVPHFTFKACVLGKFCSGKTTCLAKIAKAHGIHVMSADTLIEEALIAYQNREEVSQVTDQRDETDIHLHLPNTSSTSLKPDLDSPEETRGSNVTLSTQALQGRTVEKELRNGNAISNELLVDIVVEAIRQIPAQSRWILDGFPVDITQAHLLEKALGGSVGNTVKSTRTNLATDPNPPKPPSQAAPALDLVVLLDISDECVAQRAFSHTDMDTAAATTSHPTDKSLYLAQIPHRITSFQETWPELEKWFNVTQNILVRVEADVDEEELYRRVESVLQHVMIQIQAGHPRKGSTSSVTNEDSQGLPKNPLESASLIPDSFSYVYVDEPLSPEVSEYLCSHWDATCDSYMNNIKTGMQQLRLQHTVINHHLYNMREEYKHYLKRPDLKQELVSPWQKDFKSILDDMREDEETKAELHLRLDELCDRLWAICDKRKEEDETERDALIGNCWLEDHTAVLITYNSILMQVELEHFQATLSILKVYYQSMYSHVLPELPSNLVRIPLLDTPKIKDQYDSHPDSKEKVSNESQDQTEPVKPSQETLISDYEEAFTAISELVSAESYKGEVKEQKETLPEKERVKASASANIKKNGKQSKKQKGPSSQLPSVTTSPVPSPAPANEVENKIHQEYKAVLDHEENAAKVRIALVKGHGLRMVRSLQSRAEQTLSCTQTWLEEQYLAEMKSIEQLSEVVHHHIEAAVNLQHEMVLDGNDFYLKGDCQEVAIPHPHPPSLGKPAGSTLTISQLELLYQQLYNIAPSGLISSPEISDLLGNIISGNMGRDILSEPWMDKNEAQLMEIVSVLMDDHEPIDWCRFLLSAALPWPLPSLTQLLAVRQHFKVVDTGHKGYVDEEQYLQIELWFSKESLQPVPDDPSMLLPYDHVANLHKFFFKLFADHSFSTPRLDYVSMLQYFAADPNPRQGFIRALSVVLGQHLKSSSPDHLVKSMPRIEEATELSSAALDGEYEKIETPCVSSTSFGEQGVSIPALLAVICHKMTKMTDVTSLPSGYPNQDKYTELLVQIFRELGYMPEACVPFTILSQHPFIQALMESSTHYQLVNIHGVLLSHQDDGEAKNSPCS